MEMDSSPSVHQDHNHFEAPNPASLLPFATSAVTVGSPSSSSAAAGSASSPDATVSRYENQKRRDWNTFGQYLRNHRPPLSLSQCSGAHVLEFLRYLDQFGKTKVHTQFCPFFGHPNLPGPCACPLRQAWGSLDALIGRLSAAFEEHGGKPENNPFGAWAVRLYLREARDSQSKARGISYEKERKGPQPQQQELELQQQHHQMARPSSPPRKHSTTASGSSSSSSSSITSEILRLFGVPMVTGEYDVPSFLFKLYELVDDRDTDGVISWNDAGSGFIIHQPSLFEKELLRENFHTLSAFVHHLTTVHGFVKAGGDQWEFSRIDFGRGRPIDAHDLITSWKADPIVYVDKSSMMVEEVEKELMFDKVVTPSDVGMLTRPSSPPGKPSTASGSSSSSLTSGSRRLLGDPMFMGAYKTYLFLCKLYELVDDWDTDGVISWNDAGSGFIIHQPSLFEKELLTKIFFNCHTLSAFVRHLTTVLGFVEAGGDQLEFSRNDFRRGRRPLLNVNDLVTSRNADPMGGADMSSWTVEEEEKEHMFDKVVTPSDVGMLNRLVIPKHHAEKYFPLLDVPSDEEKGLLLDFQDGNGKPWRFRYSYWSSSQCYVLTKGWSQFVKEKNLDAGDILSFQRGAREDSRHHLFIDLKRCPTIGTHPYSPMALHFNLNTSLQPVSELSCVTTEADEIETTNEDDNLTFHDSEQQLFTLRAREVSLVLQKMADRLRSEKRSGVGENDEEHNTRTCPTRGGLASSASSSSLAGAGSPPASSGGVKLFGVRLTDGSFIKKSASMGNLSSAFHHHNHCSNLDSPSSDHLKDPADDGGYLSDSPNNHAGCSSSTGPRCAGERKKGVPWTEEEHRLFLIGLQKLGKGDWRGIARNFVVSRSPVQVASHAQKYFIRQSNASRRKRRSNLFDMVPDMDERYDAKLHLNLKQSKGSCGSHNEYQGLTNIEEVQGAHTVGCAGRKDRHSNVWTVKGDQDHPIPLSVHTDSLTRILGMRKLKVHDLFGKVPKSLPIIFQANSFVELHLPRYNHRLLWAGKLALVNLRLINLKHSSKLMSLPDLSMAQKIVHLNLRGCVKLIQVSYIRNLTKLEKLNLSNCENIKVLPSLFGLQNLKEFYLSGCSNLWNLPPSIIALNSLVVLDLKNCAQLCELPRITSGLRSLQKLNISGCTNILRSLDMKGNRESQLSYGRFLNSTILEKNVKSAAGTFSYERASQFVEEATSPEQKKSTTKKAKKFSAPEVVQVETTIEEELAIKNFNWKAKMEKEERKRKSVESATTTCKEVRVKRICNNSDDFVSSICQLSHEDVEEAIQDSGSKLIGDTKPAPPGRSPNLKENTLAGLAIEDPTSVEGEDVGLGIQIEPKVISLCNSSDHPCEECSERVELDVSKTAAPCGPHKFAEKSCDGGRESNTEVFSHQTIETEPLSSYEENDEIDWLKNEIQKLQEQLEASEKRRDGFRECYDSLESELLPLCAELEVEHVNLKEQKQKQKHEESELEASNAWEDLKNLVAQTIF